MSAAKGFTGICLGLLLGVAPLVAIAAPRASSIEVTITGEVLQPGTYQLPSGARLSDASAAGLVSAQAWPLGAALLRQSAVENQQRLKAGILFEIQANRVRALAAENLDLYSLLDRLYAMVENMPVTGRIALELDPLQQVIFGNNALLQPGDRLIYPLRPAHVSVIGATLESCTVEFLTDARPVDYLRQCGRHRFADKSSVYVIQPDGNWRRLGVASWNIEPGNVAVGAVIFVPLQERLLGHDVQSLNDELAAFLATQYQLGGLFNE